MEIYKAMGAKAIDKKDKKRLEKIENLFTSNEYVAQRKLNGERLLAFKSEDDDETVQLFGRGYSKYGARMEKTDLLPHLTAILQYLPSGTVLDGEVVYMPKGLKYEDYENITGKQEDEWFWKCREIMGSYPEKAVPQQESEGKLHYITFDTLGLCGENFINDPLQIRDSTLQRIVDIHPDVFSKYIHYLPLVYGETAKRDLFENALELGREGIIFKKLSGIYYPGKKPTGQWVKLKKSAKVDGVVIGFSPANQFTEITRDGKKLLDENGKPVIEVNRFWRNNWIGAIWIGQWVQRDCVTKEQFDLWEKICPTGKRCQTIDDIEYYLVPVAKVSGMDDSTRQQVSENKEDYFGHVVAFDYFEKTDSSYFQPVFGYFRTDKPANECMWGDE